jgi:hypothetical protein
LPAPRFHGIFELKVFAGLYYPIFAVALFCRQGGGFVFGRAAVREPVGQTRRNLLKIRYQVSIGGPLTSI